ncbi:S-adenosyl-L-methionine-dependent methyltransferase [Thelephora ganbajun]|uniref:S-adenosyl-L-methionine-dependent methyltransferase n=1 Tax=Thelephora ganbajun TaxID=370292 RepID=A0ACB6ZA88_THEGA|nr:S-adenosyl-L-methionine-dependent methyltransferase [Thelephora ganbajun]
MTVVQEQSSSSALEDFNALVKNLHKVIDTIASQVVATIGTRDPSLVSDKPSPPASSELLSAFRKFTKLSDEFSSYATSPSEHLTMIAGAFYESTALNVVSELGVADLIGKERVHVSWLAKEANVDQSRLRHVMRMLANRQVFRETEYGSDVFENNRMSSILLSSHEKNLKGFVGHWSDDGYRSADSTLKAFRPENANKSIFEVHHGMSLWDYFGRPEGAVARERGNRAMVGAEPILHGGLIYDYDWAKHGESATIVDVGAGMGGAAIELTRRFPKLRIIMQDKPEVIESATEFWKTNAPECLPRVAMVPHDFFSPQPSYTSLLPNPPKVYFLRFVLHDWFEDHCVEILKNIRDVIPKAEDGGRLYIAEILLDKDSDRFKHMVSAHMMNMTGALERTEGEFAEILRRSGFKIAKVHKNKGFISLIEAVAVPQVPEL